MLKIERKQIDKNGKGMIQRKMLKIKRRKIEIQKYMKNKRKGRK